MGGKKSFSKKCRWRWKITWLQTPCGLCLITFPVITAKSPIILLDEYDTPMQEAYAGGCWDEIVGFMKSLFNATFKTNPYLERAVMTGITRVSKESVFSDLNNLEVVTTTSDKYAASFGYFDTGMKPSEAEPERFYHGFVLGLMVELQDRYVITSNRESGFGRYDVVIEPKNPGADAIIIEFKVHDPEDEAALKDTAAAAPRIPSCKGRFHAPDARRKTYLS